MNPRPEPQRRELLAGLIGAVVVQGLVAPSNAQGVELSAQGWIDQLTQGQAVREGRVELTLPRLADNGLSVPLRVRVPSPMTAQDHVRQICLVSMRNPRPLMARFELGPHSGRAEVATRVRLNGSQLVVALVQMSDMTWWSATAEVEVTESACLDAS
jgi:sulfur-oxidizing protein SoxY